MVKKYDLLNSGVVQNTIVCDDSLISQFAQGYDEYKEIDGVTYKGDVGIPDTITAEEQAAADSEAAIASKKARLSFGMEIKARVMVINESKGWDSATWTSYRANSDLQTLSSLLVDGYLQTSLNLLSSADLSLYYTSEEKQGIIDRIQAYLDAE